MHDPPSSSNQISVDDRSITDVSCSSNQICPLIITPTVSPPPTLLLDSAILIEVCENIFKDLNKMVKSRSNLVHNLDYVSEWTSLRDRVDHMMCELQKLCLEAHDKALVDLQDWFKEVIKNMEEVNINRN